MLLILTLVALAYPALGQNYMQVDLPSRYLNTQPFQTARVPHNFTRQFITVPENPTGPYLQPSTQPNDGLNAAQVHPFLDQKKDIPIQYRQYYENAQGQHVEPPKDVVGVRKIRLTHRYFIPIGPAKVYYRRIPKTKLEHILRNLPEDPNMVLESSDNSDFQVKPIDTFHKFFHNKRVLVPVESSVPIAHNGNAEIHEIITDESLPRLRKVANLA
ncbi:hypothetical protein L596_019684 [Steinernema carpocapsae]|uniref:Uncharacterized protein n=1 Tax=Steinernema carpocapsae TaxID=34508 RepID=A0A4U5MRD9_STECR|nr:hypothetical protein L596_019684 [Steinernema carpocapsae]